MHHLFFVLSSSLSWVNLFAFEFKIPHDLVNQNWFARLRPLHHPYMDNKDKELLNKSLSRQIHYEFIAYHWTGGISRTGCCRTKNRDQPTIVSVDRERSNVWRWRIKSRDLSELSFSYICSFSIDVTNCWNVIRLDGQTFDQYPKAERLDTLCSSPLYK